MAQGRSTAILSMIQWIRTSRLSIKIFLSWPITRRSCPRAWRPALGFRVSGLGLGFRVSGLGFGCLIFGLRICGFVFDLVFGVSRLGVGFVFVFRVWDFGIMVYLAVERPGMMVPELANEGISR